MEVSSKDLTHYLGVWKRRQGVICATAAVLFGISVAMAFLWPPSYRSTATILIEEQEVPTDLVRSAINSYADQRIQTIKQQVMTRPNLLKIVDQYKLYDGLRRRSTTEDVLEEMVEDIRINVISADVVDKRTHQPTKATIAFTLSYDGESPQVAQKVANEVTSLFLSENVKSRERSAQETTVFLRQESDNLAKHIEELDQRISAFKQKAGQALPELVQLNMQLMNQVDREVVDLDQRINSLEDRRNYLEGQLATIKPNTPIVTATGERILDASERLKALRAQYVSVASYLSVDHPDIIKMKQEIEALERETGETQSPDELRKRLSGEQAKLQMLHERLGAEHPDVRRAEQMVASLTHTIAELDKRDKAQAPAKPENPAYIQIRSQLTSALAELDALRRMRGEQKRRAAEYVKRLEQTPQLEPEYLELLRERDSSAKKYQDIRDRLLESEVSHGLEVQRKGERFSLIDPPDLPEKPEKPNRPVILFLGMLLAMAGGLGAGVAVDGFDHAVKDVRSLTELVALAPLAVIPYLPNTADLRRAVRRRRLWRWSGLGAGVLLLLLVHVLWVPLDVIWFVAMRKLGLGE
jgi:uncharacterized protein involved in exopolysaccharide biosynthesis